MAGRVVVVTGAARGVGRETAFGFGRLGDRLTLGDVDEPGLEATACELGAAGAEMAAEPSDVAVFADCERLLRTALARWDTVDVLVNNAGVGLWGPAVELADAVRERVIAVNLGGVVYCTRRRRRPRDASTR